MGEKHLAHALHEENDAKMSARLVSLRAFRLVNCPSIEDPGKREHLRSAPPYRRK